ncbi:hypothetical protein AB0L06_34025 [Spirillospora sp. NPDC052269]
MNRTITSAALAGATALAVLTSSPAHADQRAHADRGEVSAQAARSTAVTFVNQSGCNASLWSADLAHGMWTGYPANWMMTNVTGTWASESNGFMTGTEGTVVYGLSSCEDPAREGAWVTMRWDNPYVGSNSYSEDVQALNGANLHLTHSGGSGNNAEVKWILW